MSKYRNSLPQLKNELFLTDGGLETTLIFLEGVELPEFAAFTLLRRDPTVLEKYFRTYAEMARRYNANFVLESASWRASPDWAEKLGYSAAELAEANRQSIAMFENFRNEFERGGTKVVVSGCLGPRGDGYVPGKTMTADEAQAYHQAQVNIFAETAADMVSAFTMNYVEEALGIVRAAEKAGMPVAIAFTVETDGRLPTGQTLQSAIEQVDRDTGRYPAYFMINCAHPTHFQHTLQDDAPWTQRIRGLRANSSTKSHAELNESTELDIGNPAELGTQYAELKRRLPQLNVLGGCCGTDARHVEEIAKACAPLFRAAM
jgi:S-methylmethionine-dependent homocysteine/selenocysteine methylase